MLTPMPNERKYLNLAYSRIRSVYVRSDSYMTNRTHMPKPHRHLVEQSLLFGHCLLSAVPWKGYLPLCTKPS